MLLRFSVANFGSIRDEQQLSMIASALKDEPSGLIDTPALRSEKILPSAVIYGANASGKSNLVRALAHMKELVRNSHRQGEPGAPIPLKPFLLDPAYATKPSVFAIDFVWNGARYAYRFEALGTEFTQESLHVWRNGPATVLFERNRQEFKFGRSLKGRNKIIENLTRPNSLFLSAAAQNNHEELTAIYSYFSTILTELSPTCSTTLVENHFTAFGANEDIIKILNAIDTGIITSEVREKHLDDEAIRFQHSLFLLIQEHSELSSKIEEQTMFPNQSFHLGHKSVNGKAVFLDIADESSGTIQILSILTSVLPALENGKLIVIDEFGNCLHTRASELILSFFTSKATNPKGAQLIVTTHDTNLLNAPALRRDQVWFTEKDETGATHLYPLTDIETRNGDNLEKGYLQGRYGAIPFAGAAADLLKTR